jgi:hypothetical protein
VPTEQQGPRGFTIVGGDPPREERPERAAKGGLAPLAFGTLVLSLSSSALVQLGVAPAPGESAPGEPNLPAAQQTIEILEMLRDKTRGNLTPDEEQLLESVLHDLHLRFVGSKR